MTSSNKSIDVNNDDVISFLGYVWSKATPPAGVNLGGADVSLGRQPAALTQRLHPVQLVMSSAVSRLSSLAAAVGFQAKDAAHQHSRPLQSRNLTPDHLPTPTPPLFPFSQLNHLLMSHPDLRNQGNRHIRGQNPISYPILISQISGLPRAGRLTADRRQRQFGRVFALIQDVVKSRTCCPGIGRPLWGGD